MNKKNTIMLVIAVAVSMVVIVVAGSGWHKKPKTVEYYKQHQDELNVMHKECVNNPAELGNTGDCINSQEAKSQLIWERARGNAKSVTDSINKGF